MKKLLSVLFLIGFGLASFKVDAQEQERKLIYRVGAGPAIEGNLGMWGLNFSNELSYYVHDRVSINPSLTYFQTVTTFESPFSRPFGDENDFMSGLFTNLTLQFDLVRTPNDFRLGVAAGPSFQVGGTAYHRGFMANEQMELVSAGYEVEKHVRLGYVTQVAVDWRNKNPDRNSSILVSMSSFEGYWGWYLMTTYRLGFRLK